MFTFNVFSVCHSLGQSFIGIVLFIFWPIHQEYFLPEMFNMRCLAFSNIFILYSFCSCLCKFLKMFFLCQNANFLIIFLTVRFSVLRSYGQFVLVNVSDSVFFSSFVLEFYGKKIIICFRDILNQYSSQKNKYNMKNKNHL